MTRFKDATDQTGTGFLVDHRSTEERSEITLSGQHRNLLELVGELEHLLRPPASSASSSRLWA